MPSTFGLRLGSFQVSGLSFDGTCLPASRAALLGLFAALTVYRAASGRLGS